MRLDGQLPDRGPGAPVRPGGGLRAPILIVLAIAVFSAGVFLAIEMRRPDPVSKDRKLQVREPAPLPVLELAPVAGEPLPPPATVRGSEPAQAIVDPASWVTNDDYPPEALRKREQGAVGIEFTVGPNGRVSDCKVAQSSGSDLLDRATCTLVTERALYSPALDTAGRAAEQTVRLRFRWRLAD